GREEYGAALRPEKRLGLSFVLKAAPFLLSVLGALLFRNLSRGVDEIERAMADRIAQWRRGGEEAAGAGRGGGIRRLLRALFPDLIGMRVLQNVLPGVLAFRLIGSLSRRWLGDAAELAHSIAIRPSICRASSPGATEWSNRTRRTGLSRGSAGHP